MSSNPPTPAPGNGVERTIQLETLWHRIWDRRRGVVLLVVAGVAVSVAAALLMPRWYRSSASLLPPSEDDAGFGVTSLLKGIAVPGIKLPTQASPGDVFVAILESRRVNEEVASRFDLQSRYRQKTREATLRELRRHTKFRLTDTGTIELSVEDRDPRRAQDMVSAYVELLDRFNREVRSSKGGRAREFLGRRLVETQVDLSKAEQALTAYQTKNKTVALSPDMSSAVETAGRLIAQRTALQIRLGVVRGYTRVTTDEERQILEQMVQLDRQLQALPTTGLELARLMRTFKTQEQLFVLLTAQYEEARLNEARDMVTVDVLDPASLPERPSRPRRLFVVAGGLALSLAVGIAWALSERGPRG